MKPFAVKLKALDTLFGLRDCKPVTVRPLVKAPEA